MKKKKRNYKNKQRKIRDLSNSSKWQTTKKDKEKKRKEKRDKKHCVENEWKKIIIKNKKVFLFIFIPKTHKTFIINFTLTYPATHRACNKHTHRIFFYTFHRCRRGIFSFGEIKRMENSREKLKDGKVNEEVLGDHDGIS